MPITVKQISDICLVSKWAPIDKLLPKVLLPKYERMNEEGKITFYIETQIFDTFSVIYSLQMVNISNEDLREVILENYSSLKNDSEIMPILEQKFWSELGSIGDNNLRIDVHPDAVISEYEKHQNNRFKEYYDIMGGIRKLNDLSLERLARKAAQYIFSAYDNQDKEVLVMASMYEKDRFRASYVSAIDILENKKVNDGCSTMDMSKSNQHYCNVCKKYSESDKYCNSCGATLETVVEKIGEDSNLENKQSKKVICSTCKIEKDIDMKYCPNCGTKLI